MPPKANTPAPSTQSSDDGVSGKWIIIGVLVVAFVGAGTSWWFRYYSTHRIAQFWGPENAQLIRDASAVAVTVPSRDISSAKGLVHLRNALLEDRSFVWPAQPIANEIQWQHGLEFADASSVNKARLQFSSDFHWVRAQDATAMLSCEPIAKGLRQIFSEFEEVPSFGPGTPAAEAASPKAAPQQ